MSTSSQQGKVALVTGAASGIGRAVADRLSKDGMDVLSVDLKPDPDGPGTPYEADLTNAAANEAAVDEALTRFGRLDVVVANAGIQHVSPIEDFPVDKWNTIVSLLLTSPFVLAKYSWPALKDSGAGRFIAIASVHGLVASPYKIAYVSAKHGVVGLCKALALEGAGDGITANAVCPGSTRTPILDASAAVYGLDSPEEFAHQQLIERLLLPDEPAALIAWLCAPEASGVTGAALSVDGGLTTS